MQRHVAAHLPVALVEAHDGAQFLLEEPHQHAVEALQLRQAEHVELQQVVLGRVRLRIDGQPLGDLLEQIGIGRHQCIVSVRGWGIERRLWSNRFRWLRRRRVDIVGGQAWMLTLALPGILVLIVGAMHLGHHPPPAHRQTFALQRMIPVRGMRIVINIVFPTV